MEIRKINIPTYTKIHAYLYAIHTYLYASKRERVRVKKKTQQKGATL